MKRLRLFLFLSVFLLAASGCQNDRRDTTSEPIVQTQLADTAPTNGKRNPGIAEDYINTNRVIWQKPDLIIDMFGDLRDKTVADVGAGTGFFAFRLVREAKKSSRWILTNDL